MSRPRFYSKSRVSDGIAVTTPVHEVPFRRLGRKVPSRAYWTHRYLLLSGPHQPQELQARGRGCPGWCNLPTATLFHLALATLAALRPRALPFPNQSPPSNPLLFPPHPFGAFCACFRSFRSLKPSFSLRFARHRIPGDFSFFDDVVPPRQSRDQSTASALPSSDLRNVEEGPPGGQSRSRCPPCHDP